MVFLLVQVRRGRRRDSASELSKTVPRIFSGQILLWKAAKVLCNTRVPQNVSLSVLLFFCMCASPGNGRRSCAFEC